MTKEQPYQVIARKFRPQTFAEVVGQETVVTTLKNALRLDKAAHGYLFCGLRGTGKTSLARLFAKALNCAHLNENQEPCNRCASCSEITNGHSLNVLEIDGASNRGIDDIRQLNETIGYAPATGKYKIYLIDEVHMLTKEAFNALLKTLEAPPKHVKFFFATTEPHKVLPTILSRCQRFDLGRIPALLIENKLKSIAQELNAQVEAEVFSLITQRAEGSLRDAESLFDQILCYTEGKVTAEAVMLTLGLTDQDVFFALDQAMKEDKRAFAFELAEKIYSSGKECTYFLEELMQHLRTLLLIKLQGPQASPSEKHTHAASLYTQEQLLNLLDFLMHSFQENTKHSLKRITLEMILLHIIRSHHQLSLDVLVQRLIALEKGIPPPPIKELPPQEEIDLEGNKPFIRATKTPQHKHDTLIHFAAVELEGTINGKRIF